MENRSEVSLLLQLMDKNLILPGGAIVIDNSLMKVGAFLMSCMSIYFCIAY